VLKGETEIEALVEPPGFQLYVVPPVALSVTDPVPQITPLTGFEEALITGVGFTVSAELFEFTTPHDPETIHMYNLPVIPSVTPFTVRDEEVAPAMFAKLPVELSCH
jgi:hypothetical protein